MKIPIHFYLINLVNKKRIIIVCKGTIFVYSRQIFLYILYEQSVLLYEMDVPIPEQYYELYSTNVVP